MSNSDTDSTNNTNIIKSTLPLDIAIDNAQYINDFLHEYKYIDIIYIIIVLQYYVLKNVYINLIIVHQNLVNLLVQIGVH